jgi:hypothetical protein
VRETERECERQREDCADLSMTLAALFFLIFQKEVQVLTRYSSRTHIKYLPVTMRGIRHEGSHRPHSREVSRSKDPKVLSGSHLGKTNDLFLFLVFSHRSSSAFFNELEFFHLLCCCCISPVVCEDERQAKT